MKKNDLKQLIKPLVKECIHEVLIEEGLLSSIVTEVTKGMQGNLVVENIEKSSVSLVNEDLQMKRKSKQDSAKLMAHRQKLMDAVGKGAYNGVNLFEDTRPLKESNTPTTRAGATDLGDPGDAGVDISSLIGNASQVWKAIK
jgi:hypothetical protein